MKPINKSQPAPRMWTDSRQKEYDIFFTCGEGIYGIKFESVLRTFEPPDFNYYIKKFVEKTKKLDASGKPAIKFYILGKPESIEIEGGKIKVKFLLLGYINQVFTFYFDPEKQDTNGKIGLRINCLMKRVKGIDSNP